MTSEFAYKLGQLYRALYDAVYPPGIISFLISVP